MGVYTMLRGTSNTTVHAYVELELGLELGVELQLGVEARTSTRVGCRSTVEVGGPVPKTPKMLVPMANTCA